MLNRPTDRPLLLVFCFSICTILFSSRLFRNELVSKIVIKGNTKEFLERNGAELCYANGKQVHIDYCRGFFHQVNGGGGAALIDDSHVLLIDDDVHNVRLARNNGHHAFQVDNNMKLVDLYNFLKDRVESYI